VAILLIRLIREIRGKNPRNGRLGDPSLPFEIRVIRGEKSSVPFCKKIPPIREENNLRFTEAQLHLLCLLCFLVAIPRFAHFGEISRAKTISAADGSAIRPYLLKFASFAVVPPSDSALLKIPACFYSGAS
jgi:hypothetical protein